MNKRWLCSDVWMDILPSFDHAQLGLKMALLSDRFDVLVDKHFDGKSELTIWRTIDIRKDKGLKSKLFVLVDGNFVQFPMPNRPLPNKIRFHYLHIESVDHSVIEFLRSNKPIWDRKGTNLKLWLYKTVDDQPLWDVLDRQIWPIFATSIRHLCFRNGDYLDNLRRNTSPTFLTDSNQLNSIDAGLLLPDGIADDGPNATAGQALAKWLHTPTVDGQPKRLYRSGYFGPPNLEWINDFKETFRRATTSVSYRIQLYFFVDATMPIEPFELVNERTNEKLTLKQKIEALSFDEIVHNLLQRCPIGETETAPVKWEDHYENSDANANLNNISFSLLTSNKSIGPLSPSAEEEKEEEADESNEN